MLTKSSQHQLPSRSALVFLLLIMVIIVAVCAIESRRQGRENTSIGKSRNKPEQFLPDTNMPQGREGNISGSIDLNSFSPGRDLVRIDDKRVHWESDNDKNDTEDDHSIHKSMDAPLRRLFDLVDDEGGVLSVRDAYRPSGVHNPTSLHKEGRAVDLTAKNISLEELAKLCWVAGFDWVLYEETNPHIHASVRR